MSTLSSTINLPLPGHTPLLRPNGVVRSVCWDFQAVLTIGEDRCAVQVQAKNDEGYSAADHALIHIASTSELQGERHDSLLGTHPTDLSLWWQIPYSP